jgi:hypothetical protein
MSKVLTVLFVLCIVTPCFAKDVYVHGYTRKDGTYVAPHHRTSPDEYKWNNYGPKDTDSVMPNNPQLRDNDNDGTPNYKDKDDDNDGVQDDKDSSQYEE